MNSELFGDYEKLLNVQVLGQPVEMPDNNTLLRGFQFASHSVSSGRFCWNGTCENCAVTVQDGSGESKQLACRLEASEGMQVTGISLELSECMRLPCYDGSCHAKS